MTKEQYFILVRKIDWRNGNGIIECVFSGIDNYETAREILVDMSGELLSGRIIKGQVVAQLGMELTELNEGSKDE